MKQIYKINEDFMDDLDLSKDASRDDVHIDERPDNDGKFMFKFITSFHGINHHWRGDDPCFYPVKTIYTKICRIVDKCNLLIEPRVSLPTARDCNGKNDNDKKMRPFTVTWDMLEDDTIDINKRYGYNEISNSTDFTYDITFDGIINCSYKRFCEWIDRLAVALGGAVKVFPEDGGELQFWVRQENGEYKDVTYSRIYTSVSTIPEKMYSKMYMELLPDKDIPQEQYKNEEWIKRQRCNIELDAIAKNALRYMASNCPLKPKVKLLYTVNTPYPYRVWNSPKPCSFVLADLEFPEKEVDLVDIDEMVYTSLPQFFPKRFMSVATPVFLFRCFNKITRKDRDEGKEQIMYYNGHDTVRTDRAYYKAEETEFKEIVDENGKKLKVEAATYYRNGHKIDQMIRKSGNLVYILFDSKGRCGRIPFSEKFAQYPFNGELNQIGKFADGHDIFKGDYGLV